MPTSSSGVAWLGRDRDISTAVSPRSFAQLRSAPPSAGHKQYLGLGQNSVPGSGANGTTPAAADRDCMLPLSSWSHPISAKELQTAATILQASSPDGVGIVTGDQFTDVGLAQRGDLSDYRIIHFATHGLVTAPKPSCPARPALVTSFGDKDSDGLLTFQEIFDLKLDADLVILSACDTAGAASVAATREAGVASGGGSALDGLVRSFIGAGGRSVIASHWPAPDDFDATKRLIGGLFAAPQGESVADALWTTQSQLMNDQQTSHPYYWAGFAIIGDGAQPLLHGLPTTTAAALATGVSTGRAAR